MRSPNRRATVALVASLVAALAAVAVFLTWGVDGHWDFALPRRAEQVAALAVVGAAVAAATVVFQTLTQNRILTPAIMGFDALYIALATGLVFVLGFRVVDDWPPFAFFSLSAGAMMIAATALYRWVLGDGTRGLYVLVLVGVIMGTFFGSVTSFMFRTMDPNEFDGLMSYLFASVGSVDGEVLTLAATVLIAALVAVYWLSPRLDVLSLGRDHAIALGLPYRGLVTTLLLLIAVLVSVATALVGPVTFLGLLVANLAYQLAQTTRHWVTLTVSSLLAITALVGGQALLQHVFHYNATLSAIINLVGGVYFILLLLREARA